MKCSKCKKDKDENDFYRRRNHSKDIRSGWQSRCIVCTKTLTEVERKHQIKINNKSNAKLKLEVFMYYSNGLMKCCCCGESNSTFLTLDHINGGGLAHRKKLKTSRMVYRDLRKRNYPRGYQILCYNCNCGRAHNNGVCPHEEM